MRTQKTIQKCEKRADFGGTHQKWPVGFKCYQRFDEAWIERRWHELRCDAERHDRYEKPTGNGEESTKWFRNKCYSAKKCMKIAVYNKYNENIV